MENPMDGDCRLVESAATRWRLAAVGGASRACCWLCHRGNFEKPALPPAEAPSGVTAGASRHSGDLEAVPATAPVMTAPPSTPPAAKLPAAAAARLSAATRLRRAAAVWSDAEGDCDPFTSSSLSLSSRLTVTLSPLAAMLYLIGLPALAVTRFTGLPALLAAALPLPALVALVVVAAALTELPPLPIEAPAVAGRSRVGGRVGRYSRAV